MPSIDLNKLRIQAENDYVTNVIDIININQFNKLKNNGIYNYVDGTQVKLTKTNKIVLRDNFVCQSCRKKTDYAVIMENTNGVGEVYYNVAFYVYKTNDKRFYTMTKDHIIPKSLSGSDHKQNLQSLCMKCNQSKADTVEHLAKGAIKLLPSQIAIAVKNEKAYKQLVHNLNELIENMPWYLKLLKVDKLLTRIIRESN